MNSVKKKIDTYQNDFEFYALLAKLQGDPHSYREAMNSPEKEQWAEAIQNELNALKIKQVYVTIERNKITENSKNILDSRWMLKRKIDESGDTKYKARLVIRGFKDKNNYDFRETYSPVSKISLVRSFLSVANKYKFKIKQLDVETAFLYRNLTENIYMELPKGLTKDKELSSNFIWKLKRSLYGLKISPKKWNDKFTESMKRIFFTTNEIDPCTFIKRTAKGIIIVLLYVDDILMASEKEKDLLEVKLELQKEYG